MCFSVSFSIYFDHIDNMQKIIKREKKKKIYYYIVLYIYYIQYKNTVQNKAKCTTISCSEAAANQIT